MKPREHQLSSSNPRAEANNSNRSQSSHSTPPSPTHATATVVDTTAASASPDSPKRPDPPTFEKQGDAVRHEKSKYTPKNTKLAYNSKAKEFQGYMQSVYGGTGDKDTCLTITPSKVFGFMYYQCYRENAP